MGFGGWCMGTLNWTSRAAGTWTVRHVADVELIDVAASNRYHMIKTLLVLKTRNHVIFKFLKIAKMHE